MSQQTINVGAAPNDGTGTPLRTAFQYTNANFTELYTALGGGTGLPGATTQVIFNDGGTNLAGDAGLTYNKTTDTLSMGAATITGDLTVDTSTLKVDSANNRVGINNASPSYTVDVLGPTTISGRFKTSGAINALYLEDSGTTPGSLYIGTSGDTFRIITGSNTRLNLDVNGNLGLGVTPSASWFTGSRVLQVGATGALWNNGSNNSGFSNNAIIGNASSTYIVSTAASYYSQTTGQHIWYTAPSGTAGNAISFTQAMTLDASGNLALGNGNLVMSTSGKGIDFSATPQPAGMTSELLNDYEEGTFTATLKGSVSDPTTPVTATGRYTKVGRQVFIDIPFSNVNTTGASGSITVTGLPFTCNGSVNAVGTVSLNGAGTYTGSPLVFLSLSTTTLILAANVSGAGNNDITHNAGAAKYMNISISYTV